MFLKIKGNASKRYRSTPTRAVYRVGGSSTRRDRSQCRWPCGPLQNSEGWKRDNVRRKMQDLHMPNTFLLGIQDVEHSDCPEDNNLLKASPSSPSMTPIKLSVIAELAMLFHLDLRD